MTIQVQYTLPEEPPSGSAVEFIPLGGDGFVAPQSAYGFRIEANGDSSGGFIGAQVAFDPQFTSLVQYGSYSAQFGSVGNDFHTRMVLRARKDGEAAQVTYWHQADSGDDTTVIDQFGYCATWNPPGILSTQEFIPPAFNDRPRLGAFMPNASNATLVLTGRVLNFDRRAREEVPLNVLLSALPR